MSKRKHAPLVRYAALAAGALLLGLFSLRASALEVPLHKSIIVPTEKPVARVSVGQPAIADVLIIGEKQVYVVGRTLGSTNVILWDDQDKSFARFNVDVMHDLTTLQQKLYQLFPSERPEVYSSQQHLVIKGEVSDVSRMDAIHEVAKSFSPDGKVMNLMQVGGVNQILLEVKVAEVNRNVLRKLGVNLLGLRPGSSKTRVGVVNGGATFPTGTLAGSTTTTATTTTSNVLEDAVTTTQDVLNGTVAGSLTQNVTEDIVTQSVTSGAPTLVPNSPLNDFPLPFVSAVVPGGDVISTTGLFLSFLDPSFFFRAVIEANKENGLAKILAEPTLVSQSGQEAEFLSGGEFPIPVPGQNGQVTIEFKEFGIGLRFLPLVLEKGRVSLKLNVKVSELTSANSVVVGVPNTASAFAIPALTQRSVKSSVELTAGESLFIAGLISDSMRDVISRFPGLGDVPVLGQLFRSQEFQKDQSELVIFVTPQLAQPTTPDRIRLPTDNIIEPSDAEWYLLGKMAQKEGWSPTQPRNTAGLMRKQVRMYGHDLTAGK